MVIPEDGLLEVAWYFQSLWQKNPPSLLGVENGKMLPLFFILDLVKVRLQKSFIIALKIIVIVLIHGSVLLEQDGGIKMELHETCLWPQK
ncbi:hypothetical protein N5V81_15870 [Escherichia coli]|nr:hypothetical protein [Escherichia coli]